MGIERHCIDKNVSDNTVSCQCLAPTFPTSSASLVPHFVKFESRKFSKKGLGQCNVIKTCCTVALKNIGMNLIINFVTIYTQFKKIQLLPNLIVNYLLI